METNRFSLLPMGMSRSRVWKIEKMFKPCFSPTYLTLRKNSARRVLEQTSFYASSWLRRPTANFSSALPWPRISWIPVHARAVSIASHSAAGIYQSTFNPNCTDRGGESRMLPEDAPASLGR